MAKRSTIFKTEEKTLEHAQAILNDKQFQHNLLLAEFSALTASYEKMYKQFRRLIRLSDNQQLRLNDLNRELAELNASKDKFFSIISHDLRNSFGAVIGLSEMLKYQVEENESVDELLYSAQAVYEGATDLYTLLENLLTWSRIQRGITEAHPEDIELAELTRYSTDLFAAQASNKQVDLKTSVARGMWVSADYNMVNTVLRNLLSNALKFTPSGGTVNISAHPHDETFIEIAVSDTGVGIRSEDIPKLFRIDVQYTKIGTDGEKGTGLGLNLCQEFVEKNGGAIWVESEIGQGTTFKFTLPRVLSPQKSPAQLVSEDRPSAATPDPTQYRMLVVDDVPVNRQLLINFLGPFGFRFREAGDGQEALKIWETWQPQLIWMDIRMPIMNGYEIVKHIKASTRGQDTAIIVLTSSISEEDYATAFAAGCDNLLRKPFKETEVLDIIHQYLSIRILYETSQEQKAKNIKQDAILTPAALTALPEELRVSLSQAAIVLDFKRCLSLIGQIRHYNAPLADALMEVVQNFRFDTLQELFKKIK